MTSSVRLLLIGILGTALAGVSGTPTGSDVADLRSLGPSGLRAFLETHREELEEPSARAQGEPKASPEASVGVGPHELIEDPSARAQGEPKASPEASVSSLEPIGRRGWGPVAKRDVGPHELNKRRRSRPLLDALDALCQQHDCVTSRLFWYTDFEEAKAEARRTGRPILSLRLLGKLSDELSCANSRFFRAVLYADPGISDYLRENWVLHWQSVRPVPQVTIDFGDGRVVKRTLTGNSIHYILDQDGRVVDALPGLYGPAPFLDGLRRGESVAKRSPALADEARRAMLRRYHREQLAHPIAFSLSSEKPVTRGYPGALEASQLATTKARVETPLLRALGSLEGSLAEDTALNEGVLHVRIHEWLINEEEGSAVDALNERVYAKLFLTPSSDPWLGLVPDAFDALTNHGIVQSSRVRHE